MRLCVEISDTGRVEYMTTLRCLPYIEVTESSCYEYRQPETSVLVYTLDYATIERSILARYAAVDVSRLNEYYREVII